MMKKVHGFTEKYHMLDNGDRVIAGISGGADSVCLFFVLLALQKIYNIEIVTVHVNHGVRGELSNRDEQFVQNLCGGHQIKCEVYHENVELIAKNRKQSFEEAGREVRREAFTKALKKYGGTKIALAHHQNDNGETLLMNLARGTGLKGLGGIQPVVGNMIRPLLCLSRKEIEDYVKGIGCGFCQDETNEQDTYTRNRLRNHIIPALEDQVNLQAVRHMNETMEQMLELQDYMEEQVAYAYSTCVTELSQEQVKILKSEYDGLHCALQGLLIRKCLAGVLGSERNITLSHIESVKGLFDKQCGRSQNLPYAVRAVRDYDGIVFTKGEKESFGGVSPVALEIPGTTYISELNLTICCKILEKPENFSAKQAPQKAYTKWLDYDIIKNRLFLRARHSGDYIVVDKEGKRQKIKSYFINEKIPRDKRGGILLLADKEQILWIVGYRMSSAFQVMGQTRRILEIKVTKERSNGREH